MLLKDTLEGHTIVKGIKAGNAPAYGLLLLVTNLLFPLSLKIGKNILH